MFFILSNFFLAFYGWNVKILSYFCAPCTFCMLNMPFFVLNSTFFQAISYNFEWGSVVMITMPVINEWFKETELTVLSGPSIPVACSGDILLLDEENFQGPLYGGTIYIGSGSFFSEKPGKECLDALLTEGFGGCPPVMILCGPVTSFDYPDGIPVLSTTLSVTACYNLLARKSSEFSRWLQSMDRSIYKDHDIQTLLGIASKMIRGTCFLSDSGYRLTGAFYDESVHDPAIEELKTNGYSSFETIRTFREQAYLKEDSNHIEYVSRESGNYNIIYMIRYQGQLVSRLGLVLPGPEPDPYANELLHILYDKISKYMFSQKGLNYQSNDAFGMIMSDLIECRLSDPEELRSRLQQVHLATQRYFHVMLVSFDPGSRQNLPWNYIMSQLQNVFPYSNITSYKGDMVLLIRKRHRSSRIRFDEEKLLQILGHYQATAAMGNASEHLTSLPTMYHQVKDTIRLGRKMAPDQKILFYEDYAMFQIIEFAEIGSREITGSTNLVHLCNNETVALVMYDERNGTDMVNILYTYLRYERNASRTAETLFLHRNTVIYKIKQIEEILECSLDDPLLRERLLFSCSVLTYMKKYRNEDILKLNKSVSPAKEKDGYKN